MSVSSRHRLAKIIRVAARVIGLTITVFPLATYLIINFKLWSSLGYGSPVPYFIQNLAGISFLALGLVACIISLRRVGFAGILLVVAAIVNDAEMIPDYLAGEGTYILLGGWGFLFLPLLIVGILFLSSWWLSREAADVGRRPMSAIGRQRLAKGIRVAAQIIGLGETVFFLFFWLVTSALYFVEESILDAVFAFVTLAIVLADNFIPRWPRWLSGTLFILASLGLVIYAMKLDWLSSAGSIKAFDALFYLVFGSPLPVAGILFLLSWWLSRKTMPSAPPPSTML